MADSTISNLPNSLTGSTLATGDLLAVDDTSAAAETKKITAGELANAVMNLATAFPWELTFALGDEDTPIAATATGVISFRMPYAVTLTAVRMSVASGTTTGVLTADINEAGSTILSTKLTIDATETTSVTAATPVVISDATIADDAVITVDWDGIGDGTAVGAKITMYGTRSLA